MKCKHHWHFFEKVLINPTKAQVIYTDLKTGIRTPHVDIEAAFVCDKCGLLKRVFTHEMKEGSNG